jgi:MFS family permease
LSFIKGPIVSLFARLYNACSNFLLPLFNENPIINNAPKRPAEVDDTLVPSLWTPMKRPAYRALWTGGSIYFIGGAMQAMAVAWYIVQVTQSPLLAALVQTALFLPMFLISMPAGVLADVANRKKVLQWSLGVQVLTGICLGLAVGSGKAAGPGGPALLLMLMFISGICTALLSPSWNTTVTDTIPRSELGMAITAVGVSYNAARAIGPAIAGWIFSEFGPGWVFVIAVLCVLAMIESLRRYPPDPHPPSRLPMERLWSGSISGIRYARYSRKILAQLVRTMAYGLTGSALWALLPVVAQKQLGLGAQGFGLLMGCLGSGAVLIGLVIGPLRTRFGLEALVSTGCLVFALVMLIVSFSTIPWVVYVALGFGGAAWLAVMSSLNTATQATASHWVRARATALHTLSALGAFAIGSALWGALSEIIGLSVTLTVAAMAMLGGLLLARAFPLRVGGNLEVLAAPPRPELNIPNEPEMDDGPIAVEIHYEIRSAEAQAFLTQAEKLRNIRKRDGATFWRIYRDLYADGHYTERFIVNSWAEYLHLRARSTLADHELEGTLRAFLRDGASLEIRRYIAER